MMWLRQGTLWTAWYAPRMGVGGAKPPLELQGQSKLADRLTHLFIDKIRDFLGGFAFFNSPSDTRFALFKNFQILGFQVAILRDGPDRLPR